MKYPPIHLLGEIHKDEWDAMSNHEREWEVRLRMQANSCRSQAVLGFDDDSPDDGGLSRRKKWNHMALNNGRRRFR